jgi:hypothetical protein
MYHPGYSPQGRKRTADDLYEGAQSDAEAGNDEYENYVDVVSAPRVISRRHHRLTHAAVVEAQANAETHAPPKPRFNIFKALVRHPNLFFQFTIRLPIDTLVDLYAIDKEFHWRFNKYSTSIIHDWVKMHCRDAAEIASWAMYPRHCISDPMLKPKDGKPHLARDAPSLRWVRMVVHRDKAVRKILTYMALDGHRVPSATARVLHKYWMLMEIKHTHARESFLVNPDYWSNMDILLLQLFLIKLDMHFSDPIHGQGLCALSELMLTQPTLTYLADLISGRGKVGYDELARMVLWTYPNEELDLDQHLWLDDDEPLVDPSQHGILLSEGWEEGEEYMESPMEMVIREGVCRRLPIHKYYLDFLLYGYTDPKTGKNLPFPRMQNKNGRKVVVEMEYDPAGEEATSKFIGLVWDELKRIELNERIRQRGRWDLGPEEARLMGVPFHSGSANQAVAADVAQGEDSGISAAP